MPGAAAILDPIDSYRREARRLRCRFAGQPGRLQHSLKRLADGVAPSGSRATRTADNVFRGRSHAACVQSGPARQFADFLRDHTPAQMTVLRYSQRLEFLRAAARLGVGRFEANLLIAAVIERHRPRAQESPASASGSVMGKLAALLLVESAVLLGAWWAVFN